MTLLITSFIFFIILRSFGTLTDVEFKVVGFRIGSSGLDWLDVGLSGSSSTLDGGCAFVSSAWSASSTEKSISSS